MSIPKEPRQLMINLMYLVLTALLALNVSAEVMNAFFTLDSGNKESISTVDNQLAQTVKGVKDLLSDESKRKYKPVEPAIDAVRSKIAEFNTYVDELRDRLIDESGTPDGKVDDKDYTVSYGKTVPKGKKNKDITTRILVNDGVGEELKSKIIETKDDILKTYTDLLQTYGDTFGLKQPEVDQRIEAMASNLAFGIDDETWKTTEKESWSDFKFRQMPLAAVLPLMSQMQSNAKSSEAALINAMAELTGGRVIEFDQFFPVVQAKKAYVIRGEPFEAKISVGTYSSQIQPENISLYANGNRLTVGEDGTAEYTTNTTSIGPQSISLKAEVTNPLTGEVSEGEATYDYEVGLRSVTVSADKMNVFYIGVDNPVSVAAAGVPTSSLRVGMSGGGGSIKRSGSGYVVNVEKPGEAKITVSGEGMAAQSFPFRVKRIPDPVARLSKSSGGAMGNGTFKAQGGVVAILDNFDFDARCQIQGFTLAYVAKRQDPVESINSGGTYNEKSRRLVNQAKPGDIYYFDNVKARCPGDKVGRPINPMVFKIK